MKVLVGDTGLIGSVLQQSANFDATFNSRNIHELTEIANMPGQVDELYLACLPATKWLVNQDPTKDLNNILSIVDVLPIVSLNVNTKVRLNALPVTFCFG